MAAGQKTVEKRRAPRIAADLLVKIEGIHEDYQRARGDISGNGVRLELSSAPGTPGDLELLHLATPDRERHVAIMGQIVRCLTIDSLGNEGSFVAVAFRFLPDRAKVRQSLLRLLRHVIRTNRKKQTLDIKHHIPAAFRTGPVSSTDVPTFEPAPKTATVFRLQVHRMALETTWPVNIGDRVQVAFRSSGARLPFEGRVIRSEPKTSGETSTYDVEVSLGELGQRMQRGPHDAKLKHDSIDLILAELMDDSTSNLEPSQRHLAGRLNRIAIPSLLNFLEIDRQSGLLRIEDDLTIFVTEGQVVDVEPQTEAPLRQLEALLGRKDGRFSFTCEPVDRPNRVQKTTTHLLLDWARRFDEKDLNAQ